MTEAAYRCELAATLKRRSGNEELLTSEIGFGDAFMRVTCADVALFGEAAIGSK